MIFLEDDNNKKNLAFILAAIFFVVLAFQWVNYNPVRNIPKNEDDFWQKIDLGVEQAGDSLQYSFEQSQVNFNNINTEFEQDLKQAALLEETKQFLEEKKNSTSSTSTVDEVVE